MALEITQAVGLTVAPVGHTWNVEVVESLPSGFIYKATLVEDKAEEAASEDEPTDEGTSKES